MTTKNKTTENNKAINYEPLLCGVNANDKIERVNLYNTGAFYESLEDKVVHTGKNRGGGTVVIGFSDKLNAT